MAWVSRMFSRTARRPSSFQLLRTGVLGVLASPEEYTNRFHLEMTSGQRLVSQWIHAHASVYGALCAIFDIFYVKVDSQSGA